MYRIFTILVLGVIVSGCLNQPPAAIEFKYSQTDNDKIINHEIEQESLPQVKQGQEYYYSAPLYEEVESSTEMSTQAEELNNAESINASQESHEEVKQQEIQEEQKIDNNKVPQSQENIKPNNIKEVQKTTKKIIKLPVQGQIISYFNETNKGINIIAPYKATVKSVMEGKVVYVGDDEQFGKLIIIKNDDLYTAYAHLEQILLIKDDSVDKNQLIGYVGQTGKINKPQLYFAVRKGKEPIDPLPYIEE